MELTFLRFGASAEEIEDLLEVCSYDGNSGSTSAKSVTIIGVSNLETSYNGINCIPSTTEAKIAECKHCLTPQRVKTFKPSAKLFGEDDSGQQYTLKAHHHMLTNIVPDDDTITPELLLQAPPFNVTFDNYNTATVSRE